MSEKKTGALRYAVGMFGTSIPINMFKTYAAAFYVMQKGVTTAQLSLVLLIYTFVDAIDNPVYGFLSDRTRTRWGRRRLWLVIGTPLLVLAFIGFYNIPGFIGQDSIFGYMLLMYILTGTLDSLINANYGALFPELFKNDEERAKTNALRQAFQLVAMVISIALTPIVTQKLGYGMTAVVYGILAGVVILYMALGCHEEKADETAQKPQLFSTLKDMLTNSKFWMFGLTNAFYSAAMSLVMSAVPFYVTYTLGLGGMANTILLAVVLLLAVGCVAIWARLVKRFGLMKVWRAALIWLGLSFVPLYFANGLAAALIGCVAVGIGYAGTITTMDLIGARVMDDDFRRHGIKREGIFSSAMGFMNRLNGLFTSLAFLLVSVVYGFESGDVPGNRPDQAARFLMVLFPICMMFLSVVVSRFLHFSEKDGAAPEK
ncbi:MAG: MFS transporter [Lachnospiraceae bacterium]|nr:MFS transporter [Lachnospiraceae bacterium]